MKSLKINNNEIVITYDNEEKAQELAKWLSNQLFEEDTSIEGNVVIYDIAHFKDKFYPIQRIVQKIVYDSDILSSERYSGAFSTDLYDTRINCWTDKDHIFKITPIRNSDGVHSSHDFGTVQYTKGISFVLPNRPVKEFVFLSKVRCHVGDFAHHELRLDEYSHLGGISILIEIGKLQF